MVKILNMDQITLLTVHDLLSISKARAFGYQNLIFKTDDSALRKIFHSYMNRNLIFSNQMKNLIKEENSFRVYVDAVRPVYYEWAKIRLAVDTDSLMTTCIEAERITYQAYKSALNNCLPSEIKNLLEQEIGDLYRIIPVLHLYRDLNRIEIENNACKESA
jgi:hypothetical protein